MDRLKYLELYFNILSGMEVRTWSSS